MISFIYVLRIQMKQVLLKNIMKLISFEKHEDPKAVIEYSSNKLNIQIFK